MDSFKESDRSARFFILAGTPERCIAFVAGRVAVKKYGVTLVSAALKRSGVLQRWDQLNWFGALHFGEYG